MKKAIVYFIGLWVMSSCSTLVTSNIAQTKQPLKTVDDVTVLNEKDTVPSGYGLMGEIQIKDKYNYNKLLEMTRRLAWEKGAKYIKVKKYSSAGEVRSDIHILSSDIYGLGDFSPTYFSSKHIRSDRLLPHENSIEKKFLTSRKRTSDFYLTLKGGNNPFVYKAMIEELVNEDIDDLTSALMSSLVIGNMHILKDASTFTLGGGFILSPEWNCEIGASCFVSSLTRNKIFASSLSMSFIHNYEIDGNNLYWTPQYELDFTSIFDADYSFISLGWTPLAFEYRFSSYGFQFGIGKFGLIFPLASESKGWSLLSNFNCVSMGITLYL